LKKKKKNVKIKALKGIISYNPVYGLVEVVNQDVAYNYKSTIKLPYSWKTITRFYYFEEFYTNLKNENNNSILEEVNDSRSDARYQWRYM